MSEDSFRSRILVESDGILAWNKPAGLATTGRDLNDRQCAQYRAMQYVGGKIWALHQLDRDTSGVVLFARKKGLIAQWQKRWNTAAIQKYYIALVHGRLRDSPMTVDAPLSKARHPGFTKVSVDHHEGKPAVTHLCELSHAPSYSLVLARLATGRTHQLRVHLQHVGCPLIGETRYNAIPCGYHDRHALHALAITTDKPPPLDIIEAPLADDLRAPARALNIDLGILSDSTIKELSTMLEMGREANS